MLGHFGRYAEVTHFLHFFFFLSELHLEARLKSARPGPGFQKGPQEAAIIQAAAALTLKAAPLLSQAAVFLSGFNAAAAFSRQAPLIPR